MADYNFNPNGFSPNPNFGQQAAEDVQEQINNGGAVEAPQELIDLFAETQDLSLSLSLNKPQDSIIVNLPPPEPGYNRAKITVYTLGGESETIDYVYKNVCVPVPPPPPGYNPNVDPDIEDAYNDCLDNIDDLFCRPIPTGSMDLELVSQEFTPSIGETINNGTQIRFRLDFRGFGNYTVEAIATGENAPPQNLFYTSGSIGLREVVSVDNTFQVPLDLDESYTSVEVLVNMLSAGETSPSLVPFVFKLFYEPPIDPPVLRTLRTDRDLSDSNKELYVLSDFVADINKTFDDLNGIDNLISKDPIRGELQSFWIKESPELEKIIFANSDDLSDLQVQTSDLYYNSGYFLVEEIDATYSDTVLDSSIQNVLDITYDHLKPYTPKEVLQRNLAKNTITIETIPEYNFYYKNYEELIADADVKENILPNMYYQQIIDQQRRDNALQIRSQNSISMVDPKIVDLVSLNMEDMTGDYYEHFVDNYNSFSPTENPELVRASRSIIVPYSFLPKLDEFSKKDEIFPMHIDIRFDTNSDAGVTTVEGKSIARLLRDSKIGEWMHLNVVDKFSGTVDSKEFVKQEDAQGSEISKNKIRHIDMSELLDNNVDLPENNSVFLGDYSRYEELSLSPAELFSRKQQFIEDIRPKIRENLRSYKSILAGKKCYKETLFYRIQKKRAGGRSIQNIWIPNDPDRSYLRYIDSQVKYDQEYTYTIYSYDLVIANEYTFGNENSDKRNITNSAKLLLLENVYKQITTKVKDRPPVAPEVSLYTYRGVDNKLLALLDKGTATYKQKEVALSEQDREFFDDVRFAQNLEENELIEFSGDDVIKKYQVFRTTTAPKKYEDFSDSLLIEVDTRVDPFVVDSYTNSTSYTDNIKPNIKYYYMFRCVDIHDQISNPSVVYEVEMINEHGTVFPLINVYDFPKEDERAKTRDIKRFIMIKPSDLQGYIQINTDGTEENYTDLLNNDKITFGVEETSVFNKKYKLRLVSKNSNKVYDLNFSFANEVKIKE